MLAIQNKRIIGSFRPRAIAAQPAQTIHPGKNGGTVPA